MAISLKGAFKEGTKNNLKDLRIENIQDKIRVTFNCKRKKKIFLQFPDGEETKTFLAENTIYLKEDPICGQPRCQASVNTTHVNKKQKTEPTGPISIRGEKVKNAQNQVSFYFLSVNKELKLMYGQKKGGAPEGDLEIVTEIKGFETTVTHVACFPQTSPELEQVIVRLATPSGLPTKRGDDFKPRCNIIYYCGEKKNIECRDLGDTYDEIPTPQDKETAEELKGLRFADIKNDINEWERSQPNASSNHQNDLDYEFYEYREKEYEIIDEKMCPHLYALSLLSPGSKRKVELWAKLKKGDKSAQSSSGNDSGEEAGSHFTPYDSSDGGDGASPVVSFSENSDFGLSAEEMDAQQQPIGNPSRGNSPPGQNGKTGGHEGAKFAPSSPQSSPAASVPSFEQHRPEANSLDYQDLGYLSDFTPEDVEQMISAWFDSEDKNTAPPGKKKKMTAPPGDEKVYSPRRGNDDPDGDGDGQTGPRSRNGKKAHIGSSVTYSQQKQQEDNGKNSNSGKKNQIMDSDTIEGFRNLNLQKAMLESWAFTKDAQKASPPVTKCIDARLEKININCKFSTLSLADSGIQSAKTACVISTENVEVAAHVVPKCTESNVKVTYVDKCEDSNAHMKTAVAHKVKTISIKQLSDMFQRYNPDRNSFGAKNCFGTILNKSISCIVHADHDYAEMLFKLSNPFPTMSITLDHEKLFVCPCKEIKNVSIFTAKGSEHFLFYPKFDKEKELLEHVENLPMFPHASGVLRSVIEFAKEQKFKISTGRIKFKSEFLILLQQGYHVEVETRQYPLFAGKSVAFFLPELSGGIVHCEEEDGGSSYRYRFCPRYNLDNLGH